MRDLITTLNLYSDAWTRKGVVGAEHQTSVVHRFLRLVKDRPDCLVRDCLPGHITASVLVTTNAYDRVLLTHHRKLGMWLQLGGHADGVAELHDVAEKECDEESGLSDIRFAPTTALFGLVSLAPVPFDLDIHEIPARPNEPAHLHYDARYLAVTSTPDAIRISDESNDLRWFSLEEAYSVTKEPAMIRQFDKLKWLAPQLR